MKIEDSVMEGRLGTYHRVVGGGVVSDPRHPGGSAFLLHRTVMTGEGTTTKGDTAVARTRLDTELSLATKRTNAEVEKQEARVETAKGVVLPRRNNNSSSSKFAMIADEVWTATCIRAVVDDMAAVETRLRMCGR